MNSDGSIEILFHNLHKLSNKSSYKGYNEKIHNRFQINDTIILDLTQKEQQSTRPSRREKIRREKG